MKLIDETETVLIVVGSELAVDAPDRSAAEQLREEVDRRGFGHPYRRAVVMSDLAWLETNSLRGTPTIAIGGPGVNEVSGRFGTHLPTVWTNNHEAMIQAEMNDGVRRAALWGINAKETGVAVTTFVARGWLEEFLDQCWRFRARTSA